jgi:hypothetical protein
LVFENIKNINVAAPDTWVGKVFLTFDVEWCSDEVLAHTLDILEQNSIRATFFVTHETALLDRMRENSKIELGIHPNFNYLLAGDFQQGRCVQEVIDYYRNIVPEAISFRSHSLTQSSKISSSLRENGFLFECNSYIPLDSGIQLKPYLHEQDGLTKVPHFWEDDLQCMSGKSWNLDLHRSYEGLQAYDFHPILLYLNCEKIADFINVKRFSHEFKTLQRHVNRKAFGVRDFMYGIMNKNSS